MRRLYHAARLASVMALAKIGLLALKTAAKPVTKWIGRRCETNERFRAICIRMAEFQNTYSARLTHKAALVTSSTRGTPRDRLFRPPRKMEEEEAVKAGATIMVELSAMGVAIACIGVDQAWNARKKRAEKAEKRQLLQRLGTLESQHAALQSQYTQLVNHLAKGLPMDKVVELAPVQSTPAVTGSETQATWQVVGRVQALLERARSTLLGLSDSES